MRIEKKRRLVVATLLSMLLLAWMGSGFLKKRAIKEAKNKPIQPFSVLVKKHIAKDYQKTFTAHGFLIPSKRVLLEAEVPGMVVEVLRKDGDRVKKGEMLAKIDLQDKKEQLEKSKLELEEAKVSLEAFAALKDKGYAAKVNYVSAKAAYFKARAQLAAIRRMIYKTDIFAPMSGVLSEQWVERGDYVKEGEKLYELVKINPLLVKVNVSQYQVTKLKVGKEVSVKLITGETLKGHIEFISPVASSATRTFSVEVTIPNPKLIKAGFSATVAFNSDKGKVHTIRPSQLFLNMNGNISVKAIDKNNKVVFYPVAIVSGNKGKVYVLGLPDEVVLIERGQGFVNEGILVVPHYE